MAGAPSPWLVWRAGRNGSGRRRICASQSARVWSCALVEEAEKALEMAPVPTLRRLNDRERYWGLSWPEWAGVVIAGAVLYVAVKYSPLGVKPTVTMVLFVLLGCAMAVMGVSGQALSPVRQLRAITSYRRKPKQWSLAGKAGKAGLVLTHVPAPDEFRGGIAVDEWVEELGVAEVDE
jgi:hypothetical protein